MANNCETIKFRLELTAEYWDLPPKAEISIDHVVKFDDEIINPTIIEFFHPLEFNQAHCLTIKRYNKAVNQSIIDQGNVIKDQLFFISKIFIDGINIQNLIFHHGIFCPEYPTAWRAEQAKNNNILPETILGETCLGHNGTWSLTFDSPFWKFLIQEMGV